MMEVVVQVRHILTALAQLHQPPPSTPAVTPQTPAHDHTEVRRVLPTPVAPHAAPLIDDRKQALLEKKMTTPTQLPPPKKSPHKTRPITLQDFIDNATVKKPKPKTRVPLTTIQPTTTSPQKLPVTPGYQSVRSQTPLSPSSPSPSNAWGSSTPISPAPSTPTTPTSVAAPRPTPDSITTPKIVTPAVAPLPRKSVPPEVQPTSHQYANAISSKAVPVTHEIAFLVSFISRSPVITQQPPSQPKLSSQSLAWLSEPGVAEVFVCETLNHLAPIIRLLPTKVLTQLASNPLYVQPNDGPAFSE